MNLFTNNISEVKMSYSIKVPRKDRPSISCSQDANKISRLFYENIEHRESFYLILLDRSNRTLGFNRISEGGISGTITDIRLILQCAILTNSSAMVLIHNHPSGNTKPSEADLKVTKKIKDAAKLMDIAVLDHIILTADTYFSFADENLI